MKYDELGFANAGGIGGGPVMVPLVSIFFEYKLKECISISYLLGSILNYFSIWWSHWKFH